MGSAPVRPDGRLTEAARIALQAVSGVRCDLLEQARIRPAAANWLRAPWYRYARGGALTWGRSIYFTRRYFDPKDLGDGSVASTWAWLKLLAHEVGHLPQAERFGLDPVGRARYLAAFTWQYGTRAFTFQRDVHDGALLEIEADRGRWVLLQAVQGDPPTHPLVLAVHGNDADATAVWCALHRDRLEGLHRRYSVERMAASSAG